MKRFFHTLLTGTLLASLGFSFGCGKKEITEADVLETARTQADAGGYAPAIATLESYLAEHPGAFPVIDALAFTALDAGDPAVAALYFKRAAEVDPSQPEYLLLAANAMRQSGDTSGAAAAYREYLTARPTDSGAWIQLAELNAGLGNRSAALDAYLQANRIQPNGNVQVAIGRNYLEAGNLAQAQVWFATAAQSDDAARPDALLGLLEIALRAQHFADAETLVATLDAESPGVLDTSTLASARADLAAWRKKQDEAAAAVAALNQRSAANGSTANAGTNTAGAEVPPEHEAAAPTDVATVEQEEGETGTETSETPPNDAGAIVSEKDDAIAVAEAEENGEQPANSSTSSTDSTTEEVKSGVTEIFRTPRRTYEEFVSLARSQVIDGNFSEAIRNFQRALARQNSDPDVWLELSEAQFQAGENVRAPASASEAIRRAPNDPQYFLQYIRVSAPTTPLARTIRELESARSRFPESPAVALTLAHAYEDQGSLNYAKRMYEIFLSLAPPTHPDRPEVEARLGR